jgi:hypothetical protein
MFGRFTARLETPAREEYHRKSALQRALSLTKHNDASKKSAKWDDSRGQ